MTDGDDGPPREWFDEEFASALVGRTLLVGITQKDHTGKVIRRYQVFGVVSEATRGRGICVKSDDDAAETWFPPDTRHIIRADPGEYRNRTTGEVVSDPDYTASWVFTGPMPVQ